MHGIDMNPLHEPGNTFTQFLGINLMQDRLDEVVAKLGKSPVMAKGDGAEYVGKACYLIDNSDTVIEFSEWELGSGCAIRKRTANDVTSCAPLKNKISNRHIEINGLKLGISKEDVLRIFGKPKTKTSNKWVYDFEGEATAINTQEIARFGNNGKYYWQFLIKITFENSVVSELELSPNVQQ
jgi:hypothetical protein